MAVKLGVFLMFYVLALMGLAATCFVFDSSSPEQEGDESHSDEKDFVEPLTSLDALIGSTEPVLDAQVSEDDWEHPSTLDVLTPESDFEFSDDDLVDELDELDGVQDSKSADEQSSDTADIATEKVDTSGDTSESAFVDPDPMTEGPLEDSDQQQGDPTLVNVTTIEGSAIDDVLAGVGVQFEVGSGIARLQGSSPDAIFGDDGNDIIFIGGNDVAYGGAGCDTFVIDGELELGNIPIVKDFDLEKDTVEISIPSPEDELASSFPERPIFDGTVSVAHENENTYIKVNGELVCMLRGLHDIDETSVRVRYDHYEGIKTDFDLQYGY